MNRRKFLQLAGSSVAAGMLPISQLLATNALAQGAGEDTKKLMCLFTPNGAPLGDKTLWHPEAGTLNLKSANKTLEPIKQHCLFLDGLRVYRNGGDAHRQGERSVLSANGPNSIDVMFGNLHSQQTPHSTLRMGPFSEYRWSTTASYKNGTQLTSIDRPITLYNQLWGEGAKPSNSTDINMLSQINRDLSRLKYRIGSLEKQKLEAHMDSLSQLENRLRSFSSGQVPAIRFGKLEDESDRYWGEWWLDVTTAFREIAVAALAMGLTRSMNYLLGNLAFRLVALVDSGEFVRDHDVSHQGGEAHAAVKRAWMGEVTKIIQLMESTPDGSGSLLDNTLVFHYSELGDLSHNGHIRMPFILMGGKHWGLNTGTTIDYANGTDSWVSHEGLLKAILGQSGIPSHDFGRRNEQALTGIFS